MTGFASQAGPADGTSDWNGLEFAVRSILNKSATMTLVRVQTVNGLLIDVQPMVSQLDGAGNAYPHGVIHNVPVWRYQAGGNAIILDPQIGDIGIAIFAHSDISSVKATKAPAPPGSRRKFSWSDAIYMGGILNPDPVRFLQFANDGSINLTGDGTITISTSGSVRLSTNMVSATGTVAAAQLSADNGVSTTAIDKNGKVLTFTHGILTGAT